MARMAALAASPLGRVAPAGATSAPLAGEIEVNGVRLPYVEQGAGEPLVFVHGVLSDLRAWEPVREEIAKRVDIAKRYRFIAYTQRYYGPQPWQDDGKEFSVATHADDLATFIAALDVGPVHLVGSSYGGLVATIAAIRNPSSIRSLILYEPSILSVLPAESPEGQAARQDRAKIYAPAIAASRAGDPIQAAKLLFEAVSQNEPGGFDREPQDLQTRILDNARTFPLLFAAPPPPAITCDELRTFTRPTLVMQGDQTQITWALISEAIGKCVRGAQKVVLQGLNHSGPRQEPAAFTAAVLEFLSKH